MIRKYRAYSLLEIMVVVAITAIIATFAISSYKSYLSKAYIASAMSSVNDLINQAINYRMENGNFPTAADLGLPADPANSGNPIYTNPTSISPYLFSIAMQDNTYGTGCTSCCVGGEYVVTLMLNGSALGRSDIGNAGGCGGIGIKLITTVSTDGNIRKLCVTDYDSNLISSNDCNFTCSSSSSGWPDAAKNQYTYMQDNQECGRSSY